MELEERMKEKQIPKIISKYYEAGKREPDVPQKRWKEQFLINENLNKNISVSLSI
jgi:hypothetical protein